MTKPLFLAEADIEAANPEEPAVEARANGFRHVREARRNALTEDYVELIADLIGDKGEARSVDIAGRLGVTQATVAKSVSRLKREGLVRAERYGALHLTEAGVQLACEAKRRHRSVVRFLLHIGVSPEIAERDAEGIEHYVSDETLDAFARLSEAAREHDTTVAPPGTAS